MSRIVRIGTEKKLYQLRPKDLPSDGSLEGSFFKWVDLRGFDLSGYDCQWVDFIDCDGREAILPPGLDFTVAVRTNWTGAAIPKTMPFCAFQMTGEVLRLHTAPPGSREEEMIQFVINIVANADTDPRDPWQVSNYHFQVEMGLTSEQIYEAFERYVFGEYPELLKTLRRYCYSEPKPVVTNVGASIRVVDPRDPSLTIVLPPAELRPLGTEDRWSAARMAEQRLDQLGTTPGWMVRMFFLVPLAWGIAVHERSVADKSGEWWRHAWPS